MATPFDHLTQVLPQSLPAAPNFGAPGAASPPPIAPPSMPNFGSPMSPGPMAPQAPALRPMQAQGGHAPNFMDAVLPILASYGMGHGNPAAIGAGLAAFVKGREMRREATESQQDREFRKRHEQAQFYTDLVKSAQSYDDEAALRNDLEAMRPLAALYGVNVDTIHVSDTKTQNKARKDASAVMDQLRKVHGAVVDDPAWQAAHSSQVNGTSMKVSDLAKLAQTPTVTDASGQAVAPSSPFKTDNPNELKIVAYARELGKRPQDLTATEIQTALGEGKTTAPPSVGSFEDYVTRRFGPTPTPSQIETARKAYNQADDRPTTGPRDRFSVQPITNPDGSTGLVRVNMDTGSVERVDLPAGAGAGKPTDTEKLSKAYLDRTIASDKTAGDFEASLAKLGAQLDVQLPNLLKSEAGQRYKQAKDEFINAALRRESGAAIQPSEYVRFDDIYFVRPGDTAATITQKQQARKRVVEGFRTAAGNMGRDVTPKAGADVIEEWVRDASGKLVKKGAK